MCVFNITVVPSGDLILLEAHNTVSIYYQKIDSHYYRWLQKKTSRDCDGKWCPVHS